jgi:hypothetical protein
VNGDVAPEPSTLRVPSDSVSLSEVRIMRRPAPKQEILDAIKEARREIFLTIKSGDVRAFAAYAEDDAPPRTQSPQATPSPPPIPRDVGGEVIQPSRPPLVVPTPRTAQSIAGGGEYISSHARNALEAQSACLVSSKSHSESAAAHMFFFTERNPPPTCRHCNVFFVTFASVACRHVDACFACASRLSFVH